MLMVFFRSSFSFMVRIIDLMASSTVLKVLSLFFEWLDQLEVGAMPDGPASSWSCCDAVGCEDGGDGEDSGSSSEAAGSSLSLAGGAKKQV